MNRHSTLGWGGALVASVFLLAACGSSATSGSSSTASAGGPAAAQTASSGASASHAPIAAAIDPCTLITQEEAKAAIGGDPGAGKPAAGTPACTYGTPGQTAGGYMLVADADVSHVPGYENFSRDTVRTKLQETVAKNGGTVTETSGIGDWGFMVIQPPSRPGSYIFFVKGSIYVSIVLIPASSNPATADVMTGLAKAAADRV